MTAQTVLYDPKLAVSIEELNEILSALEHLKERSYDSDFFDTLRKTPLSSWIRAVRERYLQQLLFDRASPKIDQKNQKRCLFSLCKLEESLGREAIDQLVSYIQKNGSLVDYATLADLLMQVRYQQLTLNKESLSLLKNAPFETWFSVLINFHHKEAEKPRNLSKLISIMQNEAANKEIDMLGGNQPLVVQQIQRIKIYRAGNSHPLTDLLFQGLEKEKKPAFCLKPIDTWTEKDILDWSNTFRGQEETDTHKLVEEHLCEIVAIISQAVFLEKGFYPRDVQYLALLTAFAGSDHNKKMISQIATGQGKTVTGTMLALLQVLAGRQVDFVTSSSVVAEETEEEIRSITRIFGIKTACNTESNNGPYALELIEGKASEAQIDQIRSNKGAAIIKKGEEYWLGFIRKDDVFIESYIDLSEWAEFRKKITESPFQSRKCILKDALHEKVFRIIRNKGIQECISPAQDETLKLQENYRSPILCGDLQSFMRADLLTEFYDKNITQNRSAFMIMDEVDRILDEMGDILYLSHDIPDMHHLNNLMFAIWESVHYPFRAEETKENIASLTQLFLDQLSFGDRSPADEFKGKILVPGHLEAFIRRRLPTWIRSAYIAKNGLSRDGEYIVAQMGEGEERGVYLVDQDTGVTSRNKELSNGVHQFLRIKHQDWPKPLSLKAIYCDPISFLKKKYKNGFFGMTGTIGSEQDYRFFEKLFAISNRCIVPRHELLDLEVDSAIIVSSFYEQMEVTAKKVYELRASRQPVEIICDSIADAKALTDFLKENLPDAPIYTRIHSFEPFSKGSKKDPIKCGDVIVTTAISGRGTDFHLDAEAEQKRLCLIKLGVYKNERADKQVDGRTARKGLTGRIIHILCPQHGESSLEEMHAIRDLHQEQTLDRIKNEDLHQNKINRQMFKKFSKLSREVKKIICESEQGKWFYVEGFAERQMAALRTHWAHWLDEAEGVRDEDALHADFQVFRDKMLALAKKEGHVKFVNGAGELTRLGIWFALEKNNYSQAMACFDQVIRDFYPFSGQALYYKAFVMLKSEKDFRTRKKAAYYLKHAKIQLRKEMERLQEPVGKMVAIDTVARKKGQGLQDSQFKKTVNGLMHSFIVHLNAIDQLIGNVTDPSFFESVLHNKETEALFEKYIKEGDIKGYRINSKNVFVTEDKRLEVLLANGYRQEIKFPSELNDYQEKIINMIFVHRGKHPNLTYQQYCKLVFDEKENTAQEKKKKIMKLSWQFLQRENVISHPCFNRSRWREMLLDRDDHECNFPMKLKGSAAGLLRLIDRYQIDMHTDSIQDLSERGRIPLDVLSFFKNSLEFDQVIRVEKKPIRWNWDSTFMLFLSGLQMMAGIFSACPALINQGINDLVFLVMSVIHGDIRLENYIKSKLMAAGIAALTAAAKPAVNWTIKSADKVVQNTAHHVSAAAQNVNSNLPKAFLSKTADVLQKGSSGLAFTQKVVNAALPTMEFKTTNASYLAQFGDALKQASSQIATQATMEYLTTTFCPDDVDRNVRKTLGDLLQLEVGEIAQEVKKICMKIFKYSESPEEAERIIQALFEDTLKEHHQKRQNPMQINMSYLSKEGIGTALGDEIFALTGSRFIANLSKFTFTNLEKIGAISQAIYGAKSFMEEVQKNAMHKLEKLQSTKKWNSRTETESADFAKFLDEEIQRLKIKIGNKSLNVLGNTVLKPVVAWAWESTIDFACKAFRKTTEKINQEERKGQFPKTLLEIRIVQGVTLEGITESILVEDQYGNRYVMKFGANREHLLSEYFTNRAYKALGALVPDVVLYDQATGMQITGNEKHIETPVLLSKYIEGACELRIALKCKELITETEIQDIIKQDFIKDCLLGNWDVVGRNYENILIDIKNKIAWRVDCGCGLDYSAWGDKRTLKPTLKELRKFRNYPETTKFVFATLTDEDIIKQIDDIRPRRESFLAVFPDHLREIMARRFDYLSVYKAKLVFNLNEKIQAVQKKVPNLSENEIKQIFNFIETKGKSETKNLNGRVKVFRKEDHNLPRTIEAHSSDEFYIHLGERIGKGNFKVIKKALALVGTEEPEVIVRGIAKREKINKNEEIILNMKSLQKCKELATARKAFSFQGKNCDKQEILQDYYEEGTLDDKRNILNIKQTIKILSDVANGIKNLHENNIIHNDLTPENILLKKMPEEEYKGIVTDFGSSWFIKDARQGGSIYVNGPTLYMPPEFFKGTFGKTIDIWSLGTILYEMTISRVPPHWNVHRNEKGNAQFTYSTKRALKARDLILESPFFYMEPYEEDIRNLIADCWNSDPCKRPSADEVHTRLVGILDKID